MPASSPSPKTSAKPAGLKRLKGLRAKLSQLLPWRRRKPSLASQLLLPGATQHRNRSERKKRRLELVGQAKKLIADRKPGLAIRLLTKALLEDPKHKRFHELLSDAATLRRVMRNKSSGDPLAELHRDIKPLALQLDAFSVYVEELEQLLDQADVPQLVGSDGTSKSNEAQPNRGRQKNQPAQG